MTELRIYLSNIKRYIVGRQYDEELLIYDRHTKNWTLLRYYGIIDFWRSQGCRVIEKARSLNNWNIETREEGKIMYTPEV